jgi:alanine racemase
MLCRIDLDKAALRHNFRQFCSIGGHSKVAPVVKSNAYGHGLSPVYSALAEERPAWLCVNYVSEAAQLRHLGYPGRILVVGPSVPRELEEASSLDLDVVIGAKETLNAWKELSHSCRVHIKFDTGMSRQGFAPRDAAQIAAYLVDRSALVSGICTHFANVEDVTDHGYAKEQLRQFDQAILAFKAAGLAPMVHAASSASSLILAESRFDLLRVGISLYGTWPSSLTRVSYLQLNQSVPELRPVLSWRSEVTTLKMVAAGQFIGYGCTFRALREMRIAVVPVGYYEGYPRLAGEGSSFVLIRGERCPIVGRICMNMMMVDTTHLGVCVFGDQVTLIGKDGSETVSAQDLANWSKTIHYEIFARIHPDISRHLVSL